MAKTDIAERSSLYHALTAADLWSEPRVAAALGAYHVGATEDGGTVLPQIDAQGNMRTARIKYYGLDGSEDEGRAKWLHYELKKQGELPRSWQLRQCAFGADLLPLHPADTVCIVPREITAVTCHTCLSAYVWLAVGRRLRADMLECLRGRNVLLYPDADLMNDWRRDMRYIRGCASLTAVPWNQAGKPANDYAEWLIANDWESHTVGVMWSETCRQAVGWREV